MSGHGEMMCSLIGSTCTGGYGWHRQTEMAE